MYRKILILMVAVIASSSIFFSTAYAASQDCGTVTGAGTEAFAYNSGWSGHACKISVTSSNDITSVGADISAISGNIQYQIGVQADVSGVPSGTFLGSDTILVTSGGCSLRTVNFATTTITSGTYWLVAATSSALTTQTHYICGSGSAVTADESSALSWVGSTGGYGFRYTIASSTGGGGGGGGGATATTTATSTPPTSAEVQLYFGSYFAFLATLVFFLRFIWRI